MQLLVSDAVALHASVIEFMSTSDLSDVCLALSVLGRNYILHFHPRLQLTFTIHPLLWFHLSMLTRQRVRPVDWLSVCPYVRLYAERNSANCHHMRQHAIIHQKNNSGNWPTRIPLNFEISLMEWECFCPTFILCAQIIEGDSCVCVFSTWVSAWQRKRMCKSSLHRVISQGDWLYGLWTSDS